jgi:hypothetical protein
MDDVVMKRNRFWQSKRFSCILILIDWFLRVPFIDFLFYGHRYPGLLLLLVLCVCVCVIFLMPTVCFPLLVRSPRFQQCVETLANLRPRLKPFLAQEEPGKPFNSRVVCTAASSFQLCCDSYHLLGRASCLTIHIWSLVYNDWRHCEPTIASNFHCCAKVSRENAAADIRKKYRNDFRESWYGQQQPTTPEIGGQIRLYRISTKGQIETLESLESPTGILEKFRGLHLFLEYLRAIVSLYLSYILTIFFFCC